MSLTRVGILAVLVTLLGAYLYWFEIPEVEREAAGTRVLPIEASSVTRIAVHFPDHSLELVRHGDDWHLTAPLDADADDAQVKGIVTSLTGAKVERTLKDPGTDLAAYGLDATAPHVELTDAKGTTVSATIGRTTPIGSKTYVTTDDGKTVEITASNLRTTVDKKPGDLRDKQLLTFADDAVTRIDIARAEGPPVVLTRTGKDAWTVSPGDHLADLTEVRSYLSSLRAARAVAFVEEAPKDLARYGLDAPGLRISVSTGKGSTPTTLLIGNGYTEGKSTRVYAKREDRPNVVGLGEWSLRALDKDVGAFRDKTVIRFDPDRVGHLEIRRRGEAPFSFDRGEHGWTAGGGSDQAVDQATVTRYLTDLRDLKGTSIVQEPVAKPLGFGLDDPEIHIVLTDRDGGALGEVIATKHADAYYALKVGGDVLYDLRDYMYTRINKARDAFAPPVPPTKAPAPTP